ncbi:uncharacterized protein LOC118745120 [Rhagoletis pomonella]|uniref:uncharacterized protein LOC118745120 n=1 Tax=Rhagoletis pomonella TaxID=28610 RepID=UPI001784D996|nr:uncharacterized protein LOC118745120 [Rhagoletis pomonella]
MKNMHFRCQTNRYGNPERVEDVLFCNFKNCFIGSCGYDLNLFVNTCLNFDALTRERYKLLHCYYEHFSATLKTLNENSIPSWQTILDDVHEFEFIGFYGLLCEMPFCQVKSDLPKCYILANTRNKEIVPISFEQEYEIILKTSHIEEIFKYGLYRFNELRVWNSNIDWEGKQENVDEFVKLNAPIN